MPPPPPNKKLAVVACMDARVNVERILGLEDGDAHIVRNAGALVTDDVKRSLETSRKLGTERVILMLHTDCGARSGDLDARLARRPPRSAATPTRRSTTSRPASSATPDDRARG